jgi:hypothetical protein
MQLWVDAGADFDGRVKMGFTLGGAGLEEVWIVEREDVPRGVVTCLSGALWKAQWPATTSGVTTVHYPFQLSTSDDDE